MKKYILLLISLSFGTATWAQNTLLPKAFIYHENEKLQLLNADTTTSDDSDVEKVYFYEGGKKKPLSVAKPKEVEKTITEKGLMLLGFDYKNQSLPTDIEGLKAYFQSQNFLFLADTLAKTFAHSKPNITLKTQQKILFLADRAFGNLYTLKIGQELEIILEQNPYFALYGDDITGQVLYKGKPLANAPVLIQNASQKDTSGNQPTSTDEKGKFYFKTNRLGVWNIQCYYWDIKNHPSVIQQALYHFESVK